MIKELFNKGLSLLFNQNKEKPDFLSEGKFNLKGGKYFSSDQEMKNFFSRHKSMRFQMGIHVETIRGRCFSGMSQSLILVAFGSDDVGNEASCRIFAMPAWVYKSMHSKIFKDMVNHFVGLRLILIASLIDENDITITMVDTCDNMIKEFFDESREKRIDFVVREFYSLWEDTITALDKNLKE